MSQCPCHNGHHNRPTPRPGRGQRGASLLREPRPSCKLGLLTRRHSTGTVNTLDPSPPKPSLTPPLSPSIPRHLLSFLLFLLSTSTRTFILHTSPLPLSRRRSHSPSTSISTHRTTAKRKTRAYLIGSRHGHYSTLCNPTITRLSPTQPLYVLPRLDCLRRRIAPRTR